MPRAYNRLPNIYADIEDVYGMIQHQVPVFEDSLVMLQHSLDRCRSIHVKEKYSLKELEKLEALKNRFIRTTNIFLEVFLQLICKIDGEQMGTIVDQINRAEKKQIVNKADDLVELKNLNLDLAQSDFPEDLHVYLNLVKEHAPLLFDYFNGFICYARKRNFYREPERISLNSETFLEK
ncbi:MAG: hypothetical protein WD491_03960 [Balneolales bacterium]